jgi:hypothetical protein
MEPNQTFWEKAIPGKLAKLPNWQNLQKQLFRETV